MSAIRRLDDGPTRRARNATNAQEAVDLVARMPAIATAGKWVYDNNEHFGQIASGGVIGAAYAIALSEDEMRARTFFANLLRPRGPSPLMSTLTNMDAGQTDPARTKAILDAWRTHLSGSAPVATNGGIAACA